MNLKSDDVPLVSIIVPNYNHSEFLRQRLDSIVNQQFQDFELIILDDASTDDSMTNIQEFANHHKVSLISNNEHNSGSVFKQWVKGINLARGKFIWIAESDDYADITFLEKTVSLMQDKDRAGMVFTDSIIVNEMGTILSPSVAKDSILKNVSTSSRRITIEDNFFDNYIHKLVVFNVSSVMFSRSALMELNKVELATFKNAGDLYTYLYILFNYEVYYVNDPLNYHRIHHNNTTKLNVSNRNLHNERVRIVEDFLEDIIDLKNAEYHLLIFLKRHFFSILDHSHPKNLEKLIDRYKDFGVLSPSEKYAIRGYILLNRISRNGLPHFIRNKMKSSLDHWIRKRKKTFKK